MNEICKSLQKCNIMPNISGEDMIRELWNEYNECTTAESVFVHQLDKLEFAIQTVEYAKREPHMIKKGLSSFFNNACISISNPLLLPIIDLLSKDLADICCFEENKNI